MLEVPLHQSWPDQVVKVGSKQQESEWVQLINFLIRNVDIFT